jgi:HlyD family secretion protein
MAILSNASFWRRPRVIASAVLLVLVALLLASRLRGPQLPGYRLEAGPLVQVVVATGRVISTSRVQVGSEVTGTVIERRVKEGDVVKPGDVLLVLRADDLEARVRQAEAALRELQASTRPQSSASLRQAEAQLAHQPERQSRRPARGSCRVKYWNRPRRPKPWRARWPTRHAWLPTRRRRAAPPKSSCVNRWPPPARSAPRP